MDLFTFVALLAATFAANAAAVTNNSPTRNSEIRQFNNTSVFTNIVPSSDLSSREAIFITPSVMFVGKTNGDIFRCLVKEPSVCELFYSYSSSTTVTAIVTHGEFLYASLADGDILKCKLHEKSSCTNFYSGNSAMNSLVVAGGYIHAGLQDGRMLKCELIQANCKIFTKFQSGIASLATTEKYIYAALEDNAEIWRCSIGSENSCRLININNGMTGIKAMYAVEETMFGISSGSTLWNCTRGNPCTTASSTACTSMAAFDRSLYITHSNISICELDSQNCTSYDKIEGAHSIAFAYSTYRIQERYVNEEKTCLSASRCPPFMSYYEINQRPTLEVFVRGSKLYNSQGVLVDTRDADMGHFGRAAIFAMSPDGQILLSNVHNTVLRTSSLFAGHPVSGAGEIVVEDGVIKSIRACSDHYRPDVELNKQVISVLFMKGYKKRIDSLPCCRDNECGQVNVEENTIADIQYF